MPDPVKPCRACGRSGHHMHGCPLAKVVKGHDGSAGLLVLARNGSTRRWRETRKRILKRDNYTCQLCGHHDASGRTLDVDHIVPHADGGSSEPSNLRVLCVPCNRGRRD